VKKQQVCRAFSKFAGFEYGTEFTQHDFMPIDENDVVITVPPRVGRCDADERRRTRRFGPELPRRPKKPESDDRSARTESSAMTVHTPKLLTPEEFASLIEVAVTAPDANIPPTHLAKLTALGYVAMTAKGQMVTGDGLIRITESE
jgi:hypothetical protein